MRSGKSRPEKRVANYHLMMVRLIEELNAEELGDIKVVLLRRIAQAYINRVHNGDLSPTEDELELRRIRQAEAKAHNAIRLANRRRDGEEQPAYKKRLKAQRREQKSERAKRRKAGILQDMIGRMRQCAQTVICIDLEMWERNQRKLTEIGITTLNRETKKIKTVHFIIEENLKHRNGKYVADNKDNFIHGDSVIVPEAIALEWTQEIVNDHEVIVGHGISQDLRMLNKRGIITEHLSVIDTNYLFCAYQEVTQPRSLERTCAKYGLNHIASHNAGNDSHINTYLFATLANRFERKHDIRQLEVAA